MSKRGGGSTVFSPGQHLYFLTADLSKIAGYNDTTRVLRPFVDKLNDVMLESLREYSGEIVYMQNQGRSQMLSDDNFDVAYLKEGKPYKLGSKGIFLYKDNGKILMEGGFSIHGSKKSTESFKLVDACGISSKDIGIGSVEDLTKYDKDKLNRIVLSKFKEIMYD